MNTNDMLFEIQDIAGKGKGLVASVDIPKGARILTESPFFRVDERMDESSLDQYVRTELNNNFPGKHALGGIFKTNALPCETNSTICAAYPTISRINHSCRHNSHSSWNFDTEQGTVQAMMLIPEGEEITFCYGKSDLISFQRRSELSKSFGFTCTCPARSLSGTEMEESNARRAQVKPLDAAITQKDSMRTNPSANLTSCRRLIKLLTLEHGDSSVDMPPRHYYDAFQIGHRDQARAFAFAELAWQGRVVCERSDSPESRRMEDLIRVPTKDIFFGRLSQRWELPKNAMPKSIGDLEFNDRLWERCI